MNADLAKYLSAMEAQAREIENQNSRLRSIRESMDKLKKEQSASFPKPPEHLKLGSDFKLDSGFSKFQAVVVGICAFMLNGIIVLSTDADSTFGKLLRDSTAALNIFLFVIPVIIGWGWMAGIVEAKERAQQAKARAEAEKQQWEAKMAQYHARKERIPIELKQLEADSHTASQAKQQAQAKLSEMGRKLGLHSDYWSLYALSHIRALLDHGRADTLKEAINRYETEQRQREHNAEMSYYASEQARYERERAEAAQRAAEAAEYQTEYKRQQVEHAAAIRKDVSEMERRQREQEWERMWGK